MTYKSVDIVLDNFWIGKTSTELFDFCYKDFIIQKDASKFSIFENKILAIKANQTVYVYIIHGNGKNVEDACTLIRVLAKYGDLERVCFILNEHLYSVNFECSITCHGRP